MTAATPAEYGAAWLDEHDPGWADRVIVERLDIRQPCNCILGQLYSTNGKSGYSRLFDRHGEEFMFRLGFDVDEETDAVDVYTEFYRLNAEWSRLVVDRQTKPVSTSPQEVTVP
jgi:hypothetical protein